MILYQFAQDMAECDVAFLNPRGDCGWHDKGIVDESGQLAACRSGPRHRGQTTFTGGGDTLQHVRRIPAGADADRNVAWSAMRPHLAGKQFFIAVVVRDAGNGGDVRRQRDRRQRHPVALVPSDKFRRDMGGIRRTPAVAEEKNFIAVTEGLRDERGDLHDSVDMFARKLLLDVRTVGKGRQNKCLHGGILGKGVWAVKVGGSLHHILHILQHQIEHGIGRCYSRRAMAKDQPIKALVIALVDDAMSAVYSINRLTPEALCFVLPEGSKALVESAVQPNIQQMPRRWDWIVLAETAEFPTSYQTLARSLPELLRTWEVQPGELVVDVSGATPAMAGALTVVALPWTSRLVELSPAREGLEGDRIELGTKTLVWTQSNPWDEQATVSRREGCELFNRGLFHAAAKLFHDVELRVSGGQKPLYRALTDLADGYELWERFHYRQAWDKLKTAMKALEMASLWGGPPGLKSVVPPIKANAGFLEKIVLDSAEVKEFVPLDLLAHAGRRLLAGRDPEAAMVSLVRALEAFAQVRLHKAHKMKSWDVSPEQLPQAIQEMCRTCYLEDVDGKYKLPLQAQFRVLAGLGDQLGQTFLREWQKMKPLLDAANHAVLGHGFEPIKSERVQQLYDVIVRLTGVAESSLPKFPVLSL